MQVSPYFRRSDERLFHWCEPCDSLHPLPWPNHGWTFNENYVKPTFTPSFAQNMSGPLVCHYNITDGSLQYHNDCWHALKDTTVPLWPLPVGYEDFEQSGEHE